MTNFAKETVFKTGCLHSASFTKLYSSKIWANTAQTQILTIAKFSKSTNGLNKNFVVIVEKSLDVFLRNIVKFKTWKKQ